jgi:hypothetical protein
VHPGKAQLGEDREGNGFSQGFDGKYAEIANGMDTNRGQIRVWACAADAS